MNRDTRDGRSVKAECPVLGPACAGAAQTETVNPNRIHAYEGKRIMAMENKTSMTDTAFRSEQKPGDRHAFTEPRPSDARIHEHKTSDVIDKVSEKAHSAGETIVDAGKDVVDHTRDGYNAVCKFTKQNPTAAVLLAFGAGAILTRLLPGR